MFKYTKHFLKKTEDLFAELAYVIRYERGSFKSGYCIVEDRKVAVINKFFDTEARINTLIEILTILEIETDKLSESSAAHYKALMKSISKETSKSKESAPLETAVDDTTGEHAKEKEESENDPAEMETETEEVEG